MHISRLLCGGSAATERYVVIIGSNDDADDSDCFGVLIDIYALPLFSIAGFVMIIFAFLAIIIYLASLFHHAETA